MSRETKSWKKYFFEFITIFIGVTLAFAFAKVNENNNRQTLSDKTLLEIRNGLDYDLNDIALNVRGHKRGIKSCQYFRKYLQGESVNKDSLGIFYRRLFASYISIQNRSGYESLKSKGLDLIEDDSLRSEIIAVYELQYEIIEKLEDYQPSYEFHGSYFSVVNDLFAAYMKFDKNGALVDMAAPSGLSEKEKNILLSNLWYIERNRMGLISNYASTVEKINKLRHRLQKHVGR